MRTRTDELGMTGDSSVRELGRPSSSLEYHASGVKQPPLPPASLRGAVHRLVVRNGLVGVGARAVTLAVGLAMTPYLLDRLGLERFGVWALASIVTGSLGLVDLGVRRALVKHVAETLAAGDREALSSLLSSALALYAALAAAIFALVVVLVPEVTRLLELPPSLRAESRYVFLVTGLCLALGTALAAFPALCDGMQRMDVTNGLGVVWLFLGAGATVWAVESGLGLRGVALAQLGSLGGFYVSTVPASLRLLGRIPISPRRVRGGVLTSLLGFGFRVHASEVAGLAARHLDKLLLSRWAGLGYVTSYEIGLKLTANAASLADYLGLGLLPAASHLAATTEARDLSPDYLRALRALLTAVLPLFFFLLLAADDLLLAWLGDTAPPNAASFARLLASGYLFAAIGSMMSEVSQGLGAATLVLRYAVLQLGLNLGLSLALLAWLGPFGAALGTTSALVLGSLYLARRLHRLLAVPSHLLTEALGLPIASGAAATLFTALTRSRLAPPLDRASALRALALEALVFFVFYVLACRIRALRDEPLR